MDERLKSALEKKKDELTPADKFHIHQKYKELVNPYVYYVNECSTCGNSIWTLRKELREMFNISLDE